jgi:ABC-type taurine transport system substrate-binding protein
VRQCGSGGKLVSVLASGQFGSVSSAPLAGARPRRPAVQGRVKRVEKVLASFWPVA